MSKTGGTTGTNQYRVRGNATISRVTPAVSPVKLNGDTEKNGGTTAEIQDMAKLAEKIIAILRKRGAIDAKDILNMSACPSHVIRQIVLDRPTEENIAIALEHPNCSADVVDSVKQQRPRSFGITLALLRLEGGPPKTWRNAAHGKTPTNRVNVAIIPGCPSWIKENVWIALANDPQGGGHYQKDTHYSEYSCAEIFAKTIEITSDMQNWAHEIADTGKDAMCEALAANPTCSPDILIKLISRKDHRVTGAVLRNPQCPEHLRAIGALAR